MKDYFKFVLLLLLECGYNILSEEAYLFFYVYPSDAGHRYYIIRQKGFAKIVVKENGRPEVVDNPKLI